MIELNELRSEKNKIASALKKRGLKDIDTELSKVIELDDLRKKLKSELDKILDASSTISAINLLGSIAFKGVTNKLVIKKIEIILNLIINNY